jgi:site-specific recombinase XerD
MSRGGKGKNRAFHFKNIQPADPAIKAWGDWLPANRSFYRNFRQWLIESSYSQSSLTIYSVAARQALGFLDKPYWAIEPERDLEMAWQRLQTHPTTPSTQACYRKGLAKLAEYLHHRSDRPTAPKPMPWERFLGTFPEWLAEDVRDFINHCARAWTADRKDERSRDTLSHVTLPLRWMVARFELKNVGDLTPAVWDAYVDARLEAGIKPGTINANLLELLRFLRFLEDQGHSVCRRTLLIQPLYRGKSLPKDVPVEELRKLQKEIQAEIAAAHRGKSRTGKLDLAWFLLMLHSGLRTCEVRDLHFADLDLHEQKARIEQSKGLKDRVVFLSEATISAIEAYLEVRGPKEALPDNVFIYRHRPLSKFYCWQRLQTYGQRCGIFTAPHRLRHSCATLLLNAGAPVLTVQAILGHKWVDTTLGYARLYDGTVAADYYSSMQVIEKRLSLPGDRLSQPPRLGQLLAMVDSLRQGTLNEAQTETIRQLRVGILALAEKEGTIQDVKVPTDAFGMA